MSDKAKRKDQKKIEIRFSPEELKAIDRKLLDADSSRQSVGEYLFRAWLQATPEGREGQNSTESQPANIESVEKCDTIERQNTLTSGENSALGADGIVLYRLPREHLRWHRMLQEILDAGIVEYNQAIIANLIGWSKASGGIAASETSGNTDTRTTGQSGAIADVDRAIQRKKEGGKGATKPKKSDFRRPA